MNLVVGGWHQLPHISALTVALTVRQGAARSTKKVLPHNIQNVMDGHIAFYSKN